MIKRPRINFSLTAILSVAVMAGVSTATNAQTASSAADASQAMIVLDASGSMWAPIAGKTKIEIARGALQELLHGWDAKVAVGLMAYGHRRKGDCGDIEVLAPAATVDAAALMKAVNAIQPIGMTPLSAAVKQAAQALKFTEQRAIVILISDGIETCKADPCELGAELKAQGVDFKAHVIGFDVQRNDEGGLRCLASATGGTYFSARDAAGLVEALRTAGRDAAAPAQAVVPEAVATATPESPPPPATIKAPTSVTAGTALAVTWTGPDGKSDYIGFAKPGASDTGGNYLETSVGNPLPMRAPERPGPYELLYRQGEPRRTLTRVAIEVTPALATLEAVETITLGRPIDVAWTGPDGPGDFITTVASDAPDHAYTAYAYTKDGSPAKVRVPDRAGTFEIRYVTGKENYVLARRTVVALAATTTITAPASAPAGSSIKVDWQGPNNDGDFVTVVAAEAPKHAYSNYFYTDGKTADAGTLKLPIKPGHFEVRYVTAQTNEVLARSPIEVSAITATLDSVASAAAGSEIQVAWTGPNYDRDYITVVKVGAAHTEYTHYFSTKETDPAAALLKMPDTPGAYEIRYVTGQDDEVLARRAIEIR